MLPKALPLERTAVQSTPAVDDVVGEIVVVHEARGQLSVRTCTLAFAW